MPPGNDNFANATPVGGLPFSSSVDATTATLEAGEPMPSCAQWYGPSGTIWYAFTPSTTQSFDCVRERLESIRSGVHRHIAQ